MGGSEEGGWSWKWRLTWWREQKKKETTIGREVEAENDLPWVL